MLPTKSFSSLKGMLSKIHQPLPLNEKSTKKLLDTLTTSFRNNLDREHGWLDENFDEASQKTLQKAEPFIAAKDAKINGSAPPVKSASIKASSATKPRAPVHRRPTDQHLRAILANPLFSYDQALGRKASPGSERDPMDIFDWAVARGLMTTKRAAGCLLAKRREAVQSVQISPEAAMAASGAGLKVVKWLLASGLERDLSFLKDTQLTGVLIQFLAVKEGLDEIVWDWIERLIRGEGPQAIGNKEAASSTAAATTTDSSVVHGVATVSFVLDKLVEAKASGADTLDEAYRTMSRGADLFDKSTPDFEGNVFWTWCYLSWMSTFKDWNLSNPSPPLYERFVSIMDHDTRSSVLLERAHLDLRHPTHPTAGPAVALLADEHLLRHVKDSAPKVEPLPGRRPAYPRRIASMGLDTVRYLAFIGESNEAQRVLDGLRKQFEGQLGDLAVHT